MWPANVHSLEQGPTTSTRFFVGGVPKSATAVAVDSALASFFAPFPAVSLLPVDLVGGTAHRGFGFLTVHAGATAQLVSFAVSNKVPILGSRVSLPLHSAPLHTVTIPLLRRKDCS